MSLSANHAQVKYKSVYGCDMIRYYNRPPMKLNVASMELGLAIPILNFSQGA